jgi:LacI family transcriptional regulator
LLTKKATIKDVAESAGVALGTASRVINGASNVAPKFRQRVEAAIEQLGYRPNVLAQGMRRGVTRTIGIIIRDITLPGFASFVRAAQEILEEEGYALILTCSEDRKDRELDLLHILSSRRVDGLIMTSCSESNEELLAVRSSMGIPVVLLDRKSEGSSDSLSMAHNDGISQAVEHLMDLGHARIALITGSVEVHSARDRIKGFTETHKRKGIRLDKSLLRAREFGGDTGFVETSALLSRANPPSAIIAGGVAMLPGIMRAVRARGLSVPEDISIVGSGDSDLAQMATPPITVVCWDYAEVGRAAASLLVQRIAGTSELEAQNLVFPTQLVTRSSCSAPKA